MLLGMLVLGRLEIRHIGCILAFVHELFKRHSTALICENQELAENTQYHYGFGTMQTWAFRVLTNPRWLEYHGYYYPGYL